MGELWGFCCEEFGENWPHYNVTTLYDTWWHLLQVKLLEGLGIQSMMITDGNNPINLFNTAEGLIGGQGQGLFGSQ